MKKLYAIILSLGIIGMSSCDYLAKDISEDMNFTVNGDLFKNTVQIEVVDAATGQAIPSLKGIYIEGPNSDVIYSQTGKKNPEYTNGIISLGVDPKYLFNDDNPVEFNVAINAVGYLPAMKTVLVYPNDLNQLLKIEMINPSVGGNSLEITDLEIALNNGKVISNELIKKTGGGPDTVYYDDDFTTIGLPAGTEFYYWENIKTGEIISALTSWEDEIISAESNGKTYFNKVGLFLDTNLIKEDLIEKPYTGSKIRAVFYYPIEELLSYTILPLDDYSNSLSRRRRKRYIISRKIAYGLIDENIFNCIFMNAALKPIIRVEYYGEDPNGKEFQVYPKNDAIFYSLRLNPNFINPTNNLPIKENDLIEEENEIIRNPDVSSANNYIIRNFPIVKDKNGYLRGQSISPNIGYYIVPEYENIINLNFMKFDYELIPDVENLVCEAKLEIDGKSIPINVYENGYDTDYNYYNKFVSNQPINGGTINLTVKYFNKPILENFKVINSFRPYIDITGPFINSSYSFYLFDLKCNGGTEVRPSIFTRVFIPSENAYYYANIYKGRWRTRGVEIGKELKLDFTFDNIKVDTTVVIQQNNRINKDVVGSQFCQ